MILENHQSKAYDYAVWDLNRLRIWRAVVSTASVTAAARTVQYSPASVSQHIIALEKSVGFPFYRKVGRGIEITDAGRRLASESETLFTEVERLTAFVEATRSGPRPRLTIGCFSSVAKEWIPAVLRDAVRQIPDLQFDIMTNEPLASTERRLGDVEIVIEPGYAGSTEYLGYLREILMDDDYMLVLPHAHALARQSEVAVAQLIAEPMVDLDVHGSPSGDVMDHATQAVGFTPNYVARADDHYGILAMVAAGIGVTVLPRLAIGDLPGGLTARPLVDPKPLRRVVLLVRREIAHLEHVEIIRAAIRHQAGVRHGYNGGSGSEPAPADHKALEE
ncbi:LysR family transcriptional regulator [Arthrobacter roseus]|uniref:LysR family transcriptional regulator n=1 Tax=Arthrobacter roseus TaxID=136274 RepID=UPI0019647E9D|nr:LysR family transcriptional regulator [Arthrobacter roseus]MBM7847366.1 DNA-binding transcriptional LysR family regulator [Arthrobacter roseus]